MKLGVGVDLRWGPGGFGDDDRADDALVRFLESHADTFSHVFVSWQPKDRNRPLAQAYFAAFDDLFARLPSYRIRALHQTSFNLGAIEPYPREEIIALTNGLIERFDLQWVNEDLGLWSLAGRALPYPLPPLMTEAGLAAAIQNTRDVASSLAAPLYVEFPGFSDGVSVSLGSIDAYDFFARVVEESGAAATLDTGHLLSYRWLRGEPLFGDLERLPLSRCLEIHLSGCEIRDGRFLDLHHGVLLDEQIELLTRLLPLCENLRAVTYEDPKFDRDGALIEGARYSFDRLRRAVS